MSPYENSANYPIYYNPYYLAADTGQNTRRTAADILEKQSKGTESSVFETGNKHTAADILEGQNDESASNSVNNRKGKTVADILKENGKLKTDETTAAEALEETQDPPNPEEPAEPEVIVNIISGQNDNQPLISKINAGETVEFDGNSRKIKLPDGSSSKYSFKGDKVLYEDTNAGIKIETNPSSENGKLRNEKITFSSGDNVDILEIEEQSTGLKATLNGETKKLSELFPKNTEVTLPNSGVKINRNLFDIKAQGESYNLDFSVMDFDENNLQKWYFNTKLTYNTANDDNPDDL